LGIDYKLPGLVDVAPFTAALHWCDVRQKRGGIFKLRFDNEFPRLVDIAILAAELNAG